MLAGLNLLLRTPLYRCQVISTDSSRTLSILTRSVPGGTSTIVQSFVAPVYASLISPLSTVFLSVLIKRTLWKLAGVKTKTWGLLVLELLEVAAGSSDSMSTGLGIGPGSDSSISTSL